MRSSLGETVLSVPADWGIVGYEADTAAGRVRGRISAQTPLILTGARKVVLFLNETATTSSA